MNDNLYIGKEAREGMMRGVKKASEAVAVTMGTAGQNSLIQDIRSPGHFSTNDGATILQAIRFENELEELGRQVLLEAVGRANKSSGDGSSTATVLTAAILEEGMKHLTEAHPMEIKRSLESCLSLIEKSLQDQKREVKDKDGNIDFKLLEQVATISAEDEEIGKRIAEIYQHIGPEGIINWEASKTDKDSYTIGTGIKIDGATYASRYMCDEENGQYGFQATLNEPYVLLAKSKITAQSDMERLIGEMQEKNVKELVIFCDEMDAPILNSFILARAPQTLGMRFLIIRMPVVWNDEWWEDLEKASGGKIVSPASGIRMKDVHMGMLGRFGKITVNRDDTFIDGIQDLTNHILALKVDGTDQALHRASRLNTRTARYYVGGHSESAVAYRRLKIEDAINSSYSALHSGILPGGGKALVNVCKYLPKEIGGVILYVALQKPMQKIIINSGLDTIPDIGDGEAKWENVGFNSRTKELVDMFDAGIIDAYDVVYGAVKNAIGVAASILTCGTVVLLPKPKYTIDEAIKQIVQNPQ